MHDVKSEFPPSGYASQFLVTVKFPWVALGRCINGREKIRAKKSQERKEERDLLYVLDFFSRVFSRPFRLSPAPGSPRMACMQIEAPDGEARVVEK